MQCEISFANTNEARPQLFNHLFFENALLTRSLVSIILLFDLNKAYLAKSIHYVIAVVVYEGHFLRLYFLYESIFNHY